MDTIEYTIDQNPKPEDDKALREGVVNFNREVIKEKATHFNVYAKENNQIVGGALVWEPAMPFILMYCGLMRITE